MMKVSPKMFSGILALRLFVLWVPLHDERKHVIAPGKFTDKGHTNIGNL